MIVLKKSCYATWDSAIMTAVTTRASSNFLSTQSDALFHPIILVVHVADQDFTHGIINQNSKFKIAPQIPSYGLIGILFQRTRLHWNSFPRHPDLLEFSNTLGLIGILFQHTRLHWNSLPSHPNLLEFSNTLGLIRILFQRTRLHWNSLPSHPDLLEFSSNALGFNRILSQVIRTH